MAVLFRILQTESEAQRSDLPSCMSQDSQPSHWATRLHVSSATSCWGCQWKTPSHKTRGPRPFKANCRGTKENHYYSYYALGAIGTSFQNKAFALLSDIQLGDLMSSLRDRQIFSAGGCLVLFVRMKTPGVRTITLGNSLKEFMRTVP